MEEEDKDEEEDQVNNDPQVAEIPKYLFFFKSFFSPSCCLGSRALFATLLVPQGHSVTDNKNKGHVMSLQAPIQQHGRSCTLVFLFSLFLLFLEICFLFPILPFLHIKAHCILPRYQYLGLRNIDLK